MMLLLVTCALGVNAYASNATLQVDRTEIEKDQTLTATFTYKGKLDSEPDFSVLEKDFTIISQGLSQSVEIINGNYREQQSWNTVLLPKREGTLVIPPVSFGTEQSNAVTLTVSPATPRSQADLGDLFLETEITPEGDGYVQQQHIFTVRIYFRGWLIDGQLSDPQLDNQDVVVQSLGEPRRYSTVRNGERYQVYERRHALFPQASGELRIGETTFSGRLRLPVGGNRLKSVSTPAISREVKPVPAEFTGDVWLPAESLTLSEVWPTDALVFEQGVPITRTINIEALGLTAAQLPVLQIEGSDAVRVYPDQPRSADQVGEKGVTGTRSIGLALVPQSAGEVSLPPVDIVWWDTTTDRQRTARLEGRTLTVLPTAGGAPEAPQNNVATVETAPQELTSNPWFYATLLCSAGWLLTLLMRPRRAPVRPTGVQTPDDTPQQLRSACRQNDARACGHLLGQLLRHESSVTPGRPLLERPESAELKRQWQGLNRLLYGPAGEVGGWSGGAELWKAYEQATQHGEEGSQPRRTLAELAPGAPS